MAPWLFDNIGGLTYKAQSCQNCLDMDLVKHVSDLNCLSRGIGLTERLIERGPVPGSARTAWRTSHRS